MEAWGGHGQRDGFDGSCGTVYISCGAVNTTLLSDNANRDLTGKRTTLVDAGLTNFTESLRGELKGCGIGLTVVAPGPVATDMWDRADYKGSYLEPALKRFRLLQQLPNSC